MLCDFNVLLIENNGVYQDVDIMITAKVLIKVLKFEKYCIVH